MEHIHEIDQKTLDKEGKYRRGKQPLWSRPKTGMKYQNETKPTPAKAIKPVGFLGRRSSRPDTGPRNARPGPVYETKWQDAVDAASVGVVDTLHLVSMSLLEHLRTREESVFTVIREYKRNGTKVCEKLARYQTGEWRNASTTVEQKCLELATLYGELSRNTQDFRAKSLKHRNQAYVEWQRQTERIKAAIRTAREGAALS
ncbi:hypothetical protein F4677DRAFT_400691 [Hypoxylon crocopeplum]|nr:hypothetical protein F4677DRAFT_400691 [Hypoxylon crocopeplum]